MKLKLAQAAAVAILLFNLAAAAQQVEPFKIVRDKVLAQFGQVIPASYQLYPLAPGTGRVFQQPIFPVGGATLRLHFQLNCPMPSTAWRVVVLDANRNKVWTYTETTDACDFWSDEIRTPTATVEVYSDEPQSKLKLSIDRIAVSTTPSEPNAITPPTNGLRELWRIGSPREIGWGKTVARLRFISDEDGKQYYCTGFLVSPSLFMTNNHCIGSTTEMRSALVDFDYQMAGVLPKTYRFKEWLITDPKLDFTLLRLNTIFPATERKALPWHVADLTGESRNMIILQHPAGKVLHLSRAECYVQGALINGVTVELTDFGHMCDTIGGSSGSAVQDAQTGVVYGLHHLGFNPNDPRVLINRAVHIKKIYELLQQKRSDVLPELSLQ